MLDRVRVTLRASTQLHSPTTVFFTGSGTGRTPGSRSNRWKPSIRAMIRSGESSARSLRSNSRARVSSVSSPVKRWATRMVLKKLRAVSEGK